MSNTFNFGEYKGHKIIEVDRAGYKFKIGLAKAEAIITIASELQASEEYKTWKEKQAERLVKAEEKAKAKAEAKKTEAIEVLNNLSAEEKQRLLAQLV